MHQLVENHATHLDHLHVISAVVWLGPNFHGLDNYQMRNLVYQSQEQVYGGNSIS